MVERQSKEGARWGADPAPVSTPFIVQKPAGPPLEYVQLCNTYGQQNVDKSIEIYNKIKHQYPHITAANWSQFHFASVALRCAQADVKNAADDGRAHSLPEALEIADRFLGNLLVINPTSESWTISFGDEKTGKAAARKQGELLLITIGGIVLVLSLYLLPKTVIFAIVLICVFLLCAYIFITLANKFIKMNSAIGWTSLAVMTFPLSKMLGAYFSLSFVEVEKKIEFASFGVLNNTFWSDDIVIWFSKEGTGELCPIVKTVPRFTTIRMSVKCQYLKSNDYSIHTTWASKKPELLKNLSSK